MTPLEFSDSARLLRAKAQEARKHIAGRRAREGLSTDLCELEVANEKAILTDKVALMARCLFDNGFGDGVEILGESPRQ